MWRFKYEKSLIALFILTSVLAFSEGNVKKVPFESMTRTDNGIAYFKDEKTPFTGIVEKKSKDGKLEAVISLKDGKLDGKLLHITLMERYKEKKLSKML